MPSDPERPRDNSAALVGWVMFFFILIVGYGVYSKITEYFQGQPPVITLAAYFVDTNGSPLPADATSQELANAHLKIKGDVRKDGQPQAGSVLLTAKKTDLSFEQAVAADSKTNGQFETEDPAFAALRPADEIYVKAEFLSTGSGEKPFRELYLNTNRPTGTGTVLAWAAAIVPLISIILFFYAFTGTKTDRKNQVAIIFSYCIIGIFLAVPLLAPVLLLDAFPNSRRAMIGAPVGLVVAHVPDPDGEVQWALNIGGYSTVTPAPTPTPAPAPTPSPSSSPLPSPSPTPRPTSRTQPTPPSPTPTPPPASPTPSPTGSPAQTATQPSPAKPSPRPTERSATAKAIVPKEADNSNDVVRVQGGLLIPLYVIILSVIGGAINMTRKVPQLQGEGERSEARVQPVSATLRSLWSGVTAPLRKKKDLQTDKENAETPGSAPSGSAVSGGNQPVQGSEPGSKTASGEGQLGDTKQPVVDPNKPVADASQPVVDPSKSTADKSADTKAEEKTDEDEANEIDAKLVPLVECFFKSGSAANDAKIEIKKLAGRMQEIFDKKKDKKPILGFDSFDDWMSSRPVIKELLTSHWRVELLSQYMYLISAPFLAIVAYYMLQLLGFTKLPILVLIAFSVGLISEKILNWLLSLASSYLRTDAPNQTPGK
jgi:hypothetical protein